jgi:hypothetical protein
LPAAKLSASILPKKNHLVAELKKVREAQLFCKKSPFSLFYSAPSVVKIF